MPIREIFRPLEDEFSVQKCKAVAVGFVVQEEQTFLKVHAKNLVKVVRIGEVMSRRIPPILTLSRLTYLAYILSGLVCFHHFQGSLMVANEETYRDT